MQDSHPSELRRGSKSPRPRGWARFAVVALVATAAAGAVVPWTVFYGGERHSYSEATRYTHNRPSFTPNRTVQVTSQADLASAVEHLRAGDLIQATTAFSVIGEFAIAKKLPPPGAVIDLGAGNDAVRFTYGGTGNFPSVWIHDTTNLKIYGGNITNPTGGSGIEIHGRTSSVLWWGFVIHDTAGGGLAVAPTGGPIQGVDLQGEVTRWGLKISLDPHGEKGTGLQAVNLSDVAGGVFIDNRVAIHAWNGPSSAMQIGNPHATGRITGNTLILAAEQLTFDSTEQVAGNGLQLWGDVPIGANVPYLSTRNTRGRAVDANGVYEGISMAGVKIAYGRATNCCSNPDLHRTEHTISPTEAWDPRHSVTYVNTKTTD